MKKILIFLALILFPAALFAQLSGSGTFADPWSGTLAGDATWSGTKYINGDITVDNEKLTISAGAVIIFLAENTDLIITGTGSLDASGASGNMITFTADDDNDGTYGEAGERWGHIFFNLPNESNQSKIGYCIIEYGDVHVFTDSRGYGGGIYSNFTNLIISNSIIRNNWGEWGGGIFVGANKSPTIRNCYIYANKSDRGGGGIYCWNGSGSLIENSIFDSNQCLEPSVAYYTGGGLAAQSNCSVKVLNCTFVNNTTTRTEGYGILLHSSPNARIINTIVWGASDKQVYCYNTTSNIIVNCAYRGITYTGGTPVSPVVLNSSNSAADGPNFVAIDGSNWSVLYISPCRDAGVNSYTGVTIPVTDYNGKQRVGTKDIGALEVQYSRWNGSSSTLWATSSNWDGSVDPSTGTGDVVVPSGLTNYPVGSTSQDYTLASGKQMIVEPGARVTLNNLTNNGKLKLNASASGTYSIIVTSYTRGGGGSEEIQMYRTGGGSEVLEDYKWHYISSPVTSLSTGVFTAVTLDLAQYVESRPALSLLQGWVAYDGYVYSTGLMNGPTFNTLTPGKGYNFWDGADNTFTFGGLLNTSNAAMALSYSGVPSLHGYNLLGNPFASGLSWDDIANGVYFTYPLNTSKGVYFTRDNVQCTYIAGVGTPGDVTGIIPPGQAFFTKTYSTGNTITIPAAARTHNSIHAPYKGSGSIPLVRLKLKRNDQISDEAVIRFDELAKTGIDNDFDAVKMFTPAGSTYIYSVSEGVNFAINGQPFPETSIDIPLTVHVPADTSYKLSAIQIDGLDGYRILLFDKVTGYAINLKISPELSFDADSGTYDSRFVIRISDILTSTEETEASENSFNIYSSGNTIRIETLSDAWDGKTGSVRVLDITGKTVILKQNEGFSKDSPVNVETSGVNGIYFVELRSGAMKYSGKTIIR